MIYSILPVYTVSLWLSFTLLLHFMFYIIKTWMLVFDFNLCL
jgi:hypothetical protein